MKNTPLPLPDSDSLTLAQIRAQASAWLADGRLRGLSPATLASRQFITDKLLWFLEQKQKPCCGRAEVREFLAYVRTVPNREEGRWGVTLHNTVRAVKSSTPATYLSRLRTFFQFCLDEEVLEVSPTQRIKPLVDRPDQIQPFTAEQQKALLAAAHKSPYPQRDTAILMFLLDTGVRASETCELKREKLDLENRFARIRGKGDKERVVYFGRKTARALWTYLKMEGREPTEPVFLSERGLKAGEAMTYSGLDQLFQRLGKMAEISAVRCSPHTCRHTFAISFLRNGGQPFALQLLLGHTSLAQTRKYVAFAEADTQIQHQRCSPMDTLK